MCVVFFCDWIALAARYFVFVCLQNVTFAQAHFALFFFPLFHEVQNWVLANIEQAVPTYLKIYVKTGLETKSHPQTR